MSNILILSLCEDNWDYNRKTLIGFSENQEDLDAVVDKYNEIKSRLNELEKSFIQILSEIGDQTLDVLEPIYIEKKKLPHGTPLTKEEQEARAKINRKNEELRKEYQKACNYRSNQVKKTALQKWAELNEISENSFEYQIIGKFNWVPEVEVTQFPISEKVRVDDYFNDNLNWRIESLERI